MPPRRRQVTYSSRPNHAARMAHAKGERQFRTYDTSYIRPKRSKLPAVAAAVVALAVLGLVVWGMLSLFDGCSAQADLLPEGGEALSSFRKARVRRPLGQIYRRRAWWPRPQSSRNA